MLCLMLTGCLGQLQDDLEPAQDRALAFVRAAAEGNNDTALANSYPDAALIFAERGGELTELLRGYEVDQAELITWRIQRLANSDPSAHLSFEAPYRDHWMLVTVELAKLGAEWRVTNMRTLQSDEALAETHAFRVTGLTGDHAGFLFIVLLLALFNGWTFYRYAKGPKPRRWILWGLFILSGVGLLTINWTTGIQEFAFFQLRFPFFTAGRAGAAAPWVLQVALPLGSVMYWLRSDAWVDRAATSPTPSAVADPPEAG
ncbi:MAG: hypothetical protein ACJAYU_001233 [Bradymonadia bacterium]|jgi:hypothetical protein